MRKRTKNLLADAFFKGWTKGYDQGYESAMSEQTSRVIEYKLQSEAPVDPQTREMLEDPVGYFKKVRDQQLRANWEQDEDYARYAADRYHLANPERIDNGTMIYRDGTLT